MWRLFYIFPAFIACTIILNGHDACPDEPPALAIDFSTSSSAVNFPSISATRFYPYAATYPASSPQSLFPSTDALANTFQSPNIFPSSDSTSANSAIVSGVLPSSSSDFAAKSFSPIPDFASSIPNAYSESSNSFSNTDYKA